jgi:hypothetical protein
VAPSLCFQAALLLAGQPSQLGGAAELMDERQGGWACSSSSNYR